MHEAATKTETTTPEQRFDRERISRARLRRIYGLLTAEVSVTRHRNGQPVTKTRPLPPRALLLGLYIALRVEDPEREEAISYEEFIADLAPRKFGHEHIERKAVAGGVRELSDAGLLAYEHPRPRAACVFLLTEPALPLPHDPDDLATLEVAAELVTWAIGEAQLAATTVAVAGRMRLRAGVGGSLNGLDKEALGRAAGVHWQTAAVHLAQLEAAGALAVSADSIPTTSGRPLSSWSLRFAETLPIGKAQRVLSQTDAERAAHAEDSRREREARDAAAKDTLEHIVDGFRREGLVREANERLALITAAKMDPEAKRKLEEQATGTGSRPLKQRLAEAFDCEVSDIERGLQSAARAGVQFRGPINHESPHKPSARATATPRPSDKGALVSRSNDGETRTATHPARSSQPRNSKHARARKKGSPLNALAAIGLLHEQTEVPGANREALLAIALGEVEALSTTALLDGDADGLAAALRAHFLDDAPFPPTA
jgi:hypothetical protein